MPRIELRISLTTRSPGFALRLKKLASSFLRLCDKTKALLNTQHQFGTDLADEEQCEAIKHRDGGAIVSLRRGRTAYSFTRFSRRAFITTVNEDSAIAAPANIGDIRMPETG